MKTLKKEKKKQEKYPRLPKKVNGYTENRKQKQEDTTKQTNKERKKPTIRYKNGKQTKKH